MKPKRRKYPKKKYTEKFGARCSHDECDKVVVMKGLCARHFKEEFGVSARKQCSREGCDNVVVKADLCGRHYREEYGMSAVKQAAVRAVTT